MAAPIGIEPIAKGSEPTVLPLHQRARNICSQPIKLPKVCLTHCYLIFPR